MESAEKRDVENDLISLIHSMKLKLLIKYGPKIADEWTPRIRSVA